MVLTFIDLISGIWAARHRGDPITSTGLKRTLVKIAVYETATMLGFVTETYLAGYLVPVTKIITAYIGITELKSVLENIEDITGMDIIKQLIDKLSRTQ